MTKSNFTATLIACTMLMVSITGSAKAQLSRPDQPLYGLVQFGADISDGVMVGRGASNLGFSQHLATISCSFDEGRAVLIAFPTLPDIVSAGKTKTRAFQKAHVQMAAFIGADQPSPTGLGFGQVPGCRAGWSILDKDKDGDFDGGSDVLSGYIRCTEDPAPALGVEAGNLDAFHAAFSTRPKCKVSGVPVNEEFSF